MITGADNLGRGRVENALFGDAAMLLDHAVGGDDCLTGGDNLGRGITINTLVGDAGTRDGAAQAGNDVLIAGEQFGCFGQVQNFMWGDSIDTFTDELGGADDFVFGSHAGNLNFIMDFENSLDQIYFDFSSDCSFEDLCFAVEGENTIVSYDGVIVTLIGFTGLFADDTFVFI
jgi:hypothetical protein